MSAYTHPDFTPALRAEIANVIEWVEETEGPVIGWRLLSLNRGDGTWGIAGYMLVMADGVVEFGMDHVAVRSYSLHAVSEVRFQETDTSGEHLASTMAPFKDDIDYDVDGAT